MHINQKLFRITASLIILILLFSPVLMAEDNTDEPGEQDEDTETIDTTEKISENGAYNQDDKDMESETKETDGKHDVKVDPLRVYGK